MTEEVNQDLEEKDLAQNLEEAAIEKPISLNQQRLELVAQILTEYQVKRVIDLGCGEGKLLKQLLNKLEIARSKIIPLIATCIRLGYIIIKKSKSP